MIYWKNRPSYCSLGGKYNENRASVSLKPPWTYRWRTGSSRHSSISTYGWVKNGSIDSLVCIIIYLFFRYEIIFSIQF
ncbi:MAG: hypothetical protein HWN80_05815 [Candidatus Lokiarchaeota archaeon]|nr:hypothetical protein [Candidatus Lokiarchaeota archaeon]